MGLGSFIWYGGGAGVAVLYSVVVGAVREFWVKTKSSDSLLASIPAVNFYQSFVSPVARQPFGLVKHEQRTRQIYVRMGLTSNIANTTNPVLGSTSMTAQLEIHVPAFCNIISFESVTVYFGNSIASSLDPDTYETRSAYVPGEGLISVKVYSVSRSYSLASAPVSFIPGSADQELVKITMTGEGIGFKGYISAFTYTGEVSLPSANASFAIYRTALIDPFNTLNGLGVGIIGRTDINDDGGGIDDSSYPATPVKNYQSVDKFYPKGSKPSYDEIPTSWLNLQNDPDQVGIFTQGLIQPVGVLSSLYASTFYGKPAATEYVSPASLPTASDWRSAIVNYSITVNAPGDRCVRAYILEPDALVSDGILSEIALDQIMASEQQSVSVSPGDLTITTPAVMGSSIAAKGTVLLGADSCKYIARTDTVLSLLDPVPSNFSGLVTILSTLEDYLSTIDGTIDATLTTRTATSGVTCTLGTATESTVQVPSPGRGTIEGITYLP